MSHAAQRHYLPLASKRSQAAHGTRHVVDGQVSGRGHAAPGQRLEDDGSIQAAQPRAAHVLRHVQAGKACGWGEGQIAGRPAVDHHASCADSFSEVRIKTGKQAVPHAVPDCSSGRTQLSRLLQRVDWEDVLLVPLRAAEGQRNGGDQPCVQICVALLSIRVPVGTAHLGEAPQG